MSIEEAGGNLQFSIESLNNLPRQWISQYSQVFVQIEIVHGKTSYPLVSTAQKALNVFNQDFILFEELASLSLYPSVHIHLVLYRLRFSLSFLLSPVTLPCLSS